MISAQFSNREIAILIWLSLFLLWGIFNKSIRRTIPPVIKAILNRHILIVFSLMAIYVFGALSMLSRLGLWSLEFNLKDTIFWAVTVAFGMVLSFTHAWHEDTFFRSALLNTVKITIVIEFVANAYSFGLLWELALVPVLALSGALLAMAETKPEHASFAKLLRALVVLIGFVILWHSLGEFIANWSSLNSTEILKTLFMPSILTLTFLPFVYLLALAAMYETVFIRLRIWNPNSDVIGFAKLKILSEFGLSLRNLSRWSRHNPRLKVNSATDVRELLARRPDLSQP